MANLLHVGTIELVSLISGKINDVPAKIDTGADSSSIWASQISEADGKLSFVLFAESSPFYSGEVIVTKDFTRSRIKNSFGHTERRYKTTLQVGIGGKKINAKFTLANRKNNTYPVLIGRRTLAGKFLVDVGSKTSKSELG